MSGGPLLAGVSAETPCARLHKPLPRKRATHQLVTDLIGRELRREGLPTGTFGDLEQEDVLLAKTADRSVLGCMNDMAFMCEHAIAETGGLARTDLARLNQSLRRNINSARGYCPPIELTARRLTA